MITHDDGSDRFTQMVWMEITEAEFGRKVRQFHQMDLCTNTWGDGKTRTITDASGKAVLKIADDRYYARRTCA